MQCSSQFEKMKKVDFNDASDGMMMKTRNRSMMKFDTIIGPVIDSEYTQICQFYC